MTLQEFYDRRDEFIGRKVICTKTFEQDGVIEDITLDQNGFLSVHCGNYTHGGIEEVCSIYPVTYGEREFITVSVRYCGSIYIDVSN